jgi:hypothetical protein
MTIKNRELPIIEWDALPLLLTDKQTAAIINVSPSVLRKARCEGITGSRTPLPKFVKVGGRIRYRLSDVQRWVDALSPREVI